MDSVISLSDIVAVAGSYLTLHPAGRVYKAVCPFHVGGGLSLQIDPKSQTFKCSACDKSGDVVRFVELLEVVSREEAIRLLARRAGAF